MYALLKFSAPPAVDVSEDEHAMAVCSFDHDPHAGIGMTPLSGTGRLTVNGTIASYAPNPNGWTSIGEGLAFAHGILDPVTGYDVKAMVVLTDGQENHVYGYLDWVMLDLEGMKPRDGEAAEEIRKLRGYIKENQGRVKDRDLRRKGYPMGSGGIESANKFISHVRLKRSGAWWYVEQANEMLALRCAKYNGTFRRVFQRYQQRAMRGQGLRPS